MALLSPDSSTQGASISSPLPSPRGILSPIVTSPGQPSPRPAVIAAKNRFSTFSIHSNSSLTHAHNSRPQSMAFPQFHSSLNYALVRDFAYPSFHPLHYGPQPEDPSGATTPSSEAHTHQRRVSDPAPSFDEPKSKFPGSWLTSSDKFGEKDGPPWSEDEDLQSPVVTSVRHRRKPEERRSSYTGANGQGNETDHINERNETANGPGDEFLTFPSTSSSTHQTLQSETTSSTDSSGRKRDSHFASSILSSRTPTQQSLDFHSNSSQSDDHWDVDDSRYSRDYQFTIVSPDEEMHGKAVALFDFARENENELPLVEGQIILVSYRHGQGWLVAQDPKTGESGLVPEEYVRLLRDIEGGWNGLMNGSANNDHIDSAEAKTPTQETAHGHRFSHGQTHGHGHSHTHGHGHGHGHSRKESKEYYTPVVSTFSTSREDFKEPWPREKIASPLSSTTPTLEFSRRGSEILQPKSINDEVEYRPNEDKTSSAKVSS